MQLQTVEVEHGDAPVGSVIWLHGLGADGHDFEPIVAELNLTPSLRFIFPHAPVRPVTVNGGMEMRAWYDIKSLTAEGRADVEGITDSVTALNLLIDIEIDRGVPAEKIVIAGFSQGGAVAIQAMLTSPYSLAGLLALSTYMALPVENGASRKDLPIFMAHGTFDPMLPIELGRQSADRLRELGYTLELSEYEMAHAVCAEEIDAVGAWLNNIYTA